MYIGWPSVSLCPGLRDFPGHETFTANRVSGKPGWLVTLFQLVIEDTFNKGTIYKLVDRVWGTQQGRMLYPEPNSNGEPLPPLSLKGQGEGVVTETQIS